MDWDSGSIQSLDVVKSWISNCMDYHEDCMQDVMPLPSRILDVSLSNDMIALVEGSETLGRYASLSYCVRKPVFENSIIIKTES
jgi:hypothetical protein